MRFSLYRRMSIIEAEKALKDKRFYKPESEVLLPRKWFSTSILKTHYFKSPFYNGETIVVKVDINLEYFRRIFETGLFIDKEPNGFYGYNESKEDILYARTHKTIPDFYNIGFLDLDTFNRQFDEIEVLPESGYLDYMERVILGEPIKNFQTFDTINDRLEFYVQNSYDTTAYAYRYQAIMPEMIDPLLKRVHFDKDLENLKKRNLNRFPTTFKVRFKKGFEQLGIYNEFSFSMDIYQLAKYASYVESVRIVSIEERKDVGKRFIQISGDNAYTKHERVEGPLYNRVSFQDFNSITINLLRKGFKIDDIKYFLPNLKDVEGINQVDPRHIDSLKTHIEKTINMSSLVVNYFHDQGMEIDSLTLVYLKWMLLLHDLGKPYCECLNIHTRYSQFGEKEKYTDMVMNQILDDDIAFPIKSIYKIFKMSSLTLNKKIKNLMKSLLLEITNYYQVDGEEAFKVLNSFVKVAFLAKVSHSASMKTRSFCSYYVDDLMFMDRVYDCLVSLGDYDFSFDYEYFYSDIFRAYEEIIEGFYVKKSKSTLDNVRGMLQNNPNDFQYVYDLKLSHVHKIEDASQYNYDDIICAYFMEDNEVLLKYFSGEIIDTDKHGQIHSERVGVLSYILGHLKSLSEEDIEILMLASKYHDIGRKVRDDDRTHSIESVNLLRKDKILEGSPLRDYVYFLVEAHGFKDKDDLSIMSKYSVDSSRALMLLSIFKDADALDRVRYDTDRKMGSVLNIKYLRNEESIRLVKFAYMLNAEYKLDKRELSSDIKKLIKD